MERSSLKSSRVGEIVKLYPVIPGVRDEADIEAASRAPSKLVFLLTGTILNIEDNVYLLKKAGKEVFVHLDLIKGLSPDRSALEYLKEIVDADGVISTHISLLKSAKKMGLKVVQRLFLLDSKAVKTGIEQASDLKPDFLEVLPGIIPEYIEKISKYYFGKIIAGGLVRTKEQILAALKAGASAVSTSCKDLWKIE